MTNLTARLTNPSVELRKRPRRPCTNRSTPAIVPVTRVTRTSKPSTSVESRVPKTPPATRGGTGIVPTAIAGCAKLGSVAIATLVGSKGSSRPNATSLASFAQVGSTGVAGMGVIGSDARGVAGFAAESSSLGRLIPCQTPRATSTAPRASSAAVSRSSSDPDSVDAPTTGGVTRVGGSFGNHVTTESPGLAVCPRSASISLTVE